MESIPISDWGNIAARYIKGKRRLTDAEVIDLGKRCTEAERSICYLREKSKNDDSVKSTSVAKRCRIITGNGDEYKFARSNPLQGIYSHRIGVVMSQVHNPGSY